MLTHSVFLLLSEFFFFEILFGSLAGGLAVDPNDRTFTDWYLPQEVTNGNISSMTGDHLGIIILSSILLILLNSLISPSELHKCYIQINEILSFK